MYSFDECIHIFKHPLRFHIRFRGLLKMPHFCYNRIGDEIEMKGIVFDDMCTACAIIK